MGSRNGFKYNHAKNRLDLYVGGTVVDTFDQPEGRTYYVNYATGSDSNDGLSWGSAFKQVNAAIIQSEADRDTNGEIWDTPASGTTTYDYTFRNRIIIQGVNADYTRINYTTNGSIEPMFTDLYGIGGWQRATLMGQVVIGHHDGTYGALDMYAPLGTNWYNCQFEGGTGSIYAADVDNAIGCEWLDCAFISKANGIGTFYSSGTFCGNHFDGCLFESAGGTTTYLMNIAGSNSSDCLVENCIFVPTGTTTNAIRWVGWGIGDCVRNCTFQGGGTVAVGIADTSPCGLAIQGNKFGSGYTDCYTNTVATGVACNHHAEALES